MVSDILFRVVIIFEEEIFNITQHFFNHTI